MVSERRREYCRRWRKAHYEKRGDGNKRREFDNYSYRIVPNTWRNLVETKSQYITPEITSPIVIDLMRGKTIYVDYTLPHGAFNNHPFRTLYSYFSIRGYRLRVHVVDVVDKEEYRKLLMWAEPIKTVKYVSSKEEEKSA